MKSNLISELLEVCKKHVAPSDADLVLREPYIPYVPARWNGILVLAESQNLSNTNIEYVEYLKGLNPSERMQRLGRRSKIDIQPWDDGTLKLAIEAAFGTPEKLTACSNAVPWSQVEKSTRNKNPSAELVNHSIGFWKDSLSILAPKHIVACGAKARKILESIQGTWKQTWLKSPSPLMLSRVSGMFPESDLLARFPEVEQVAQAHPEWLQKFRQNKIFFACHAVCVAKS